MKLIKSNLVVQGSTTTDINHSSTVAYLGKGNYYSIMEQISHLLEKHIKGKRKEYNQLMVCCYKFKSKEDGQLGIDTVFARNILSNYAFVSMF